MPSWRRGGSGSCLQRCRSKGSPCQPWCPGWEARPGQSPQGGLDAIGSAGTGRPHQDFRSPSPVPPELLLKSCFLPGFFLDGPLVNLSFFQAPRPVPSKNINNLHISLLGDPTTLTLALPPCSRSCWTLPWWDQGRTGPHWWLPWAGFGAGTAHNIHHGATLAGFLQTLIQQGRLRRCYTPGTVLGPLRQLLGEGTFPLLSLCDAEHFLQQSPEETTLPIPPPLLPSYLKEVLFNW